MLNKPQLHAVKIKEGPVLVLAGAGTGKTRVITERIVHMIQSGISPTQIVALSFTNKAALEMKSRIQERAGETKVTLSTFHSFALNLIKASPDRFGHNLKVCDDRESNRLMTKTLEELRLLDVLSVEDAKLKISYYKDLLFEEDDFLKLQGVFEKNILRDIFKKYQEKLRFHNFLDFDDLVYFLVKKIKTDSDFIENLLDQFRYYMVDEFQDTSFGQFELIRLLNSRYENICVVGDDDQSIYSWRGAQPKILKDFLATYPTAQQIILDQNYRSNTSILAFANFIIGHNTNRIVKSLWSEKKESCRVQIKELNNDREESRFVAETIVTLNEKNDYRDIAILVRSKAQIKTIELALMGKNIPYVIAEDKRLFDNKEAKDLLCYLKFLSNDRDLLSFFRILELFVFSSNEAKNSDFSFHDLFNEVKSNYHPKESLFCFFEKQNYFEKNEIKNCFLTLEKYKNRFSECSSVAHLDRILEDIYNNLGLRDLILKTSPNMTIARYRMDTVEKTVQVFKESSLEIKKLPHILNALTSDIKYEENPNENKKDQNAISILTIHSSKGLEYNIIFVVGVEEDILPHEKSLPLGEEEERRLFYVAVTRAKKELYITYCQFRAGTHQKISRFLSNIPKSLYRDYENKAYEDSLRHRAAMRIFNLFR